jgi:recombination protein RecR
MSGESVKNMAEAISSAKKSIKFCSVCQNLTDSDTCAICSSPKRDRSIICVVESPKDVSAIEKTGEYHGLYHVLHGALSPTDGISPDDIRIKELLSRLDNSVAEIIMATNPTVNGTATAVYIARLVEPLGINVTRIAHGIPVGGDLEYADEVTLVKAIEGRRSMI